VPGTPQAVLAWESRHLPSRFARMGSGSTTVGSGVTEWYDMFSLSATSVLDSRQLLVAAISAGAKTTDLRVDAQVTWLPARPAGSMVDSASVHAVTFTLIPPVNGGAKPPKPATVTGKAKVAALVKLINSVPSASPAVYNCGPDDGSALKLTFSANPGSAQPGNSGLAVSTSSLSGCVYTSLTVGGHTYQLGGPGLGNGPALAAKAVHIAGLTWKLPG
jgi:hypothetical protein